MSGGTFKWRVISHLIADIEDIVDDNKDYKKQIEDTIIQIKVARAMSQRLDYLLAGDYTIDEYNERLREDLERLGYE